MTLDALLAALVEHLTELRVGEVTPVDVSTFAELGILSADLGIVLRLSDGTAAALKITSYRYGR